MDEPLERIAPGEILLEELMHPHAISQNRLLGDIEVPVARINETVMGKRTRRDAWAGDRAPVRPLTAA